MLFKPEIKATECKTRNACVDKLSKLANLSSGDISALVQATTRVRGFGAHVDLLRDAESNILVVIQDGFACRYRQMQNGTRQNLAYLVPGDVFKFSRLRKDSVGSLSACRIALVPRAAFQYLTDQHPNLIAAIGLAEDIEEAVTREWLLSLGNRSATERTAHLLCEVFMRLQAVGLADENGCSFPVSQAELANTLGLSPVHMNRTLQVLRGENLIELKGRTLLIKNWSKLTTLAEFTPDYLVPQQVVEEAL